LELFEEIEDCGKRELEEETGLRVTHMSQFTVLNLIYREKNFHCVLFVMVCRLPNG
jgi:ADP-ribose pyrophosphatase YjhB (NUDIX family)